MSYLFLLFLFIRRYRELHTFPELETSISVCFGLNYRNKPVIFSPHSKSPLISIPEIFFFFFSEQYISLKDSLRTLGLGYFLFFYCLNYYIFNLRVFVVIPPYPFVIQPSIIDHVCFTLHIPIV